MAYNAKKAAQLVAAFILNNHGAPIEWLKLVKLIYLTDRESFKKFGFPVLEEQRFSLRWGPMNEETYDHIQRLKRKKFEGQETEWRSLLTYVSNKIGLKKTNTKWEDLSSLSDADKECLNSVWQAQGQKTEDDLIAWTHEPMNIPEWEPKEKAHGRDSRQLIPEERIIKFAARPQDIKKFLKRRQEEEILKAEYHKLGLI